ncbi:hypothetical protein D1007_52184 [Hordeum vulgare]|nr:hypothetical protein D1007_52184 [Hordeum vulgare]
MPSPLARFSPSVPVARLVPPMLLVVAPGDNICVLSRSPVMDNMEARLRLVTVAYVGGARPSVSCVEAAEAIVAQLSIPRHAFSVHCFHPEDFLIVFATAEFRDIATDVGSVEHQGFELFFRLWLSQAQATARVKRVLVDIMIEGIPSHAWECETAAKILGSWCDIISLAPETASREDLSLFKLRAWCRDPHLVPVEKRLWIPEPVEEVELPVARRQACSRLLEYPTLVHIGRMRDFTPPENWHRTLCSDGSGQSGLSDDSDDSFTGGKLQVLPWTRGVRDIRGPVRAGGDAASAGVGRSYVQAMVGRVGSSSWRLPPMDPSPGPGPAGRAAAVEPPIGSLPVISPHVPVLETVVVLACSPSEELVVVASLEQD